MRVMAVKLTGNVGSRYVLAQPAMVVDPMAVTGNPNTSYNVYRPLELSR